MNFLMFTYPRSGQHLLKAHMKQRLENVSIETTHLLKNKNYDHIITLVRDPIYSIASFVAMNCYFDKTIKPSDQTAIIKYCKWAKLKYIGTYEEMIKECDTFISYHELINNPDDVIEKISNKLNIKINDNIFNQSLITDKPSNKHLISSKNTEYYDISLKLVSEVLGLDEADNLFNIAIERCL